MEFEPTTTEFRSDAVTYRAIRPWIQLALKADFEQLLQFYPLFSVRFISGIAFVSHHVYVKWNFVEEIKWV